MCMYSCTWLLPQSSPSKAWSHHSLPSHRWHTSPMAHRQNLTLTQCNFQQKSEQQCGHLLSNTARTDAAATSSYLPCPGALELWEQRILHAEKPLNWAELRMSHQPFQSVLLSFLSRTLPSAQPHQESHLAYFPRDAWNLPGNQTNRFNYHSPTCTLSQNDRMVCAEMDL